MDSDEMKYYWWVHLTFLWKIEYVITTNLLNRELAPLEYEYEGCASLTAELPNREIVIVRGDSRIY